MIHVDGSMGEGGGQVLRSALTLSLLTQTPFRIENIRAGRPKPGLAAQHLKSVEAAAAVGEARVEGAAKGSTEILFEPGEIRPGRHRFDIGTAGSTSLVLQTVVCALGLAAASSQVTVTGGTHVPWSPCFHFLDLQWAPFLRDVGFVLRLRMSRAGFYPRGGGVVSAEVGRVTGPLKPLRLPERGSLLRIRGISGVGRLNQSIAERQKRQAMARLEALGVPIEIQARNVPASSPGTFLVLVAEFERSRCCASALGERGKPAETVADEAVDQIREALDTGAAVDAYVADQLLLPLALVRGESEFATARVTKHLGTNAEVVRRFLPDVRVEICGEEGGPGRVRISGVGHGR